MKITNRSDGSVSYHIEEMRIRRVFSPGETKLDISKKELTALYQKDGGRQLLEDYLMVDDKEWVEQYLPDAPIEYFWTQEDIKKSMIEDSEELFSETIDYAPRGVLDIIKQLSWRLPLTDMNKIKVLKEKLGFDTMRAIDAMSDSVVSAAPRKGKRLRKEG